MRNRRSCSCLALAAVVLVIGLGMLVGTMAVIQVRGSLSILELAYLHVWLTGQQAALDTPAGTDTSTVVFIVNTGDTAGRIGENLANQGLITDAELFRNYARLEGLDSQLEAGTYFLNQTQTIPQIAEALTDSSTATVPFRSLEGWRREEIAAAIDDKATNPLLTFSGADFMAVTSPGGYALPSFAAYVGLPDGVSLEGFLYPETYFLPPDATATVLRDIMLSTFQERVDGTLKAQAEADGLTLYQAVTLASIVEREALFATEGPQIAGVYLNRLAIGMNLDADPTVQYSIGYRDGTWWPNITTAEYRSTQSTYNTYLHSGLPPGPIASPSLAAIQAVIFPVESGYYYFRADCSGSGYHVFAVTFEEHVANGNCP